MECKEIKSRADFYRYVEITDYLISLYRKMDNETEETKITVLNYLKQRVDIINTSKYAECNYKYKGINC